MLVRRIHIIGGKNHGKTTLVVELVQHLTALGKRVATVKHTHHRHELDTPGKDSYRHRQAGAHVVGVLSRDLQAIYVPLQNQDESQLDARYDNFAPMMDGCDMVLVEGDTKTSAMKIEVWRAERGTEPLAVADRSILGVVTDDNLTLDRPIWPRRDVAALAHILITLLDDTPDRVPA